MRLSNRPAGFSLIEMMVVMFIFLVVSGAVFGLLNTAQIRYRSEQQFLDALQGARLGLEQVTRDIHRAGFPALNAYDMAPTNPDSSWVPDGVPVTQIAVPFVGMVGANIDQTCTVNGGANPCTIPGPFELAIEADLEPDGTVDWVYYRLDTPGNGLVSPPLGGGRTRTLYRAVKPKVCGGPPWITNPMTCTSSGGGPGGDPRANATPFVDNILQDPGAALDPTTNQAVFTYVCAGGAASCTPENIIEVYIVLQTQATSPDLQTRQVRALTLESVAQVLNPPR